MKFLVLLFILLPTLPALAAPSNCFGLNEGCVERSRSYVSGSSSGQVKMNPSAVPIEEGLGLEGLVYKTEIDFMLVRGNGRIGAAISPSNSESTFFGPPAVEIEEAYLNRYLEGKKYPSHKYTLATAMGLFDNNSSGITRLAMRLGAMGKYNDQTGSILPGGGATLVLGPLNLNYSYYKDETKLDYQSVLGPGAMETQVFRYHVQTYGAGIYLSSLVLDYSHLQLRDDKDLGDPSEIDLYTATVLLRQFILTAAHRSEKSSSRAYNFETKSLEIKPVKNESFGGIQYKIGKHIMLGGFYNYYLLHEFSAALTLFW